MKRMVITGALFLGIIVMLAVAGCEKEKIVESTEYIHDVEYVSDTVFQVDTVYSSDSVTIYSTDTLFMVDTIVQTEYIYDTVTNTIVDTVTVSQCEPNQYLALAALEYYCDPLVIEFIYQEFGYDDGWIFYLSTFQLEATSQSPDVYDFYGFIDYWTLDWSGYYPLEYYWRLTYIGGDPANPNNWQMSDPPGAASSHQPGIKLNQNSPQAQSDRR